MSPVTDMRAVDINATGNIGEYRTELVDATSGAITRTLPAASASPYKTFTIKKVDASANEITIEGDGSDTIDGQANVVLSAQYEKVTVTCNSIAWYIVG
ncbi:MAG: hypothetical protein A2Y89_07060 [Chloroflexi bacterium RBG_13_51_18]|nr:MAG: hypothetical protein A2Y89_07060 [Chloroflexi bacterium RBG_13_51_18]